MKNLVEMNFCELEDLGAGCIADIDHNDLFEHMRHNFLVAAKNCGEKEQWLRDKLCDIVVNLQGAIEAW